MLGSRPLALVQGLQALALLLATAGTLRLLDWLPRQAARAAQVREFPSLEAVEQAAGRRLALPSWFPRSLPWPPARVQVLGSGPDAVALEIIPAGARVPEIILAQSIQGPLPFPASFFPPAMLLESGPIAWKGGEARLSRFRGDDGANWTELAWEQDGQSFAFRSRGSLEQLIDLAKSVHGEMP